MALGSPSSLGVRPQVPPLPACSPQVCKPLGLAHMALSSLRKMAPLPRIAFHHHPREDRVPDLAYKGRKLIWFPPRFVCIASAKQAAGRRPITTMPALTANNGKGCALSATTS